MKSGFKIQLVAHEPQLRDPIAICFDENGRMFAVEMIDHPESRQTPLHPRSRVIPARPPQKQFPSSAA
jgi:hypothetical protein